MSDTDYGTEFLVSLKYKAEPVPPDRELKERYPEVEAMAQEMRRQLWFNRDKGDQPSWQSMDVWQCWNELQWHSAKLSMAIKLGNSLLIKQYAADCANISMFLLDGRGIL